MKNSVHCLIIEDDYRIGNFMSMALEAKGYKVTIAKNGNSGILSFCTENPDIVLLDLGLPDMDGNCIIEKIRKTADTPILIVSARENEKDKIRALDAGANDYVVKPFSMGELLARVRVMQRYIHKSDISQKVYEINGLVIDTNERKVLLDQKQIHLTPIEYKLIVFLVSNKGKVVTHNQISKNVLGYDELYDSTNIRVHMSGLRRKIEKDKNSPKFISTEIGVGYRFMD